MKDDIPMPDCINALARMRHGHPQRDLIVALIVQCKNHDRDPYGMRPRILWTINKIEEKAGFVR